MAIRLGKVNVADLAENNYKILGIGINTRSNSNGIFAVNYTTIQQAKNNLINLIMTKKGERVMQPEFGCDIHKLLFEPIGGSDFENRVVDYIEDAVSMWLPYIQIQDIQFLYDDIDVDNNKLRFSVYFALKSNPNIFESVQITINN